MESADLNSPSDDGRIEALLRRPSTPLPDDGFSARVLTALPPARAIVSDPSRQQWLVALAGATVGIVFAASGVIFWPALSNDVAGSVATLGQSCAVLIDPIFLAALGITGLSLLYVFRSSLRGVIEL